MDKFVLNINLSNMAVSQFCNYNFNSFCEIAGKYYGASDLGILELTGKDDDGTNIDAFLELVLSDFGISNMKRIRAAYVGGEADGMLTLTTKDDENNSRTKNLDLASNSKQRSAMVSIDRDGLGRYWQERIDNTNGAYFAIDSIELALTILGRKPR